MSRRLRIAVVGPSPCNRCHAACCKQNGHDFAVLLEEHERRRFAAFAVQVPIEVGGQRRMESVLPYRDGRCVFLGEDDRCTIYEDRPASCRLFECTLRFNTQRGHDRFLQLNPRVLALLESL